MDKRSNLISTFFFFIVLSGVMYAVSQTPIGMGTRGIVEVALSPMRDGALTIFAKSSGKPSGLQLLQDENSALRLKLVTYQNQAREIQALRDQFAVTTVNPQTLLPAKIVGRRTIVPGFSLPDQMIINRGKSDRVQKGNVVIYKDFFLGQVTSVSEHTSIVDMSYRKGFFTSASVADSGAPGIIKGQGQGEMLLDNVILSDTLRLQSNVLTKGAVDESGKGVPPGLLIGKIISIDKKPSALFQTAKVSLALDIARLDNVFILR
jgi:rod shape-determining protein MreC